MITLKATRFINGTLYELANINIDPAEALARLAKETDFGCRLMLANRTMVIVEVWVLNARDTFVFEGSEEEIKPLRDFLKSLSTALFAGTMRIKAAMMVSLGVPESEVRFGVRRSFNDLAAAVQLSRECGISFREAILL